MSRIEKISSLKLVQRISTVFLVITILVFVNLGFYVQYQDIRETYSLAKETAAFLTSTCEKYDNYMLGLSARSKQDLLDKAIGLRKFISEADLTDSDFLHEFIHTEHVSGIVVLDRDGSCLAQADMDDQNAFALWRNVLSKPSIQDILQYPQKTYIDHTSLRHIAYDFAVIASDDSSKLILCYSSTEKPSYDPYELTIQSVLTNNSFHKNPLLAIADGTQILSTNSSILSDMDDDQYQQLDADINWQDDQLITDIRQKLSERSDDKLPLSVSFGIAATEQGDFSFEQAYERADQEMYRDKQASRIQR